MLRYWAQWTLLLTTAVSTAQTLDYGRDIRPILAENCFHCHGQDESKRMAGLRLDAPGDARIANVVARITADAKSPKRMPPSYSNRTLTPQQVSLLEAWVKQGAPYAKHWAFVPPVKPVPPASNVHPIDAFVASRLETEKLQFNRPASPAAWLRRVSLDLTGLPPTPAELDAFTKNPQYAKAVDRLLASPAYGERMALDWLDVARYADTHGFNNDSSRSMWRWRDWVIDSFNRNQPYDQFLTEQLAGDLLPKPTLEQRIATGYGRNHVINSEGGIIDEEYRVEYVIDRVRTLGMSWLGLTLECARCHDHKFDPITQRDHYRFYAFFNNVPEIGEDGRVANAVPMIPAPTREMQRKLAALTAEVERLRSVKSSVKSVSVQDAAWTFTGRPAADQMTASIQVSKREPLTFSGWVKRTSADTDVALISNIRHDYNPADVSYARGIELRISGDELEFLYSDRLPAYAIHVRTRDARLTAGEWHQVTAMYQGVKPGEDPEMRGHASWVRLFVDGRELATDVLHDGLQLPDSKSKPGPATFRVGWDNKKGSAHFAGEFEDLRIFNRLLTIDEVLGIAAAKVQVPSRELAEARARMLDFERKIPTVMVMSELAQPRATHVLKRGAYDAPAERVEPGVPEAMLGAWPTGAPRNRLGLAQWLTKPDHPLTARVVVNRFWQQLFGTGLVKTSENFGLQGENPSHPELLDWLAREFVDSGWNVKSLLKQIVLSQTYRQDAFAPADAYARDPENRLLARGPRFRLPAEVIRDQALFAAGALKQQIGGPSVYPLQPDDLYKGIVVAAEYPGTRWLTSKGDDLYRRSLYTFWKRTSPHPTFTVFDAPDREFCIVRRSSTNTPLQALTLLNDPIYVQAAQKLADRATREGGSTVDSRVSYAFRLATGRTPAADEVAVLTRVLKQPGATLATVTAMILNLDEVITK